MKKIIMSVVIIIVIFLAAIVGGGAYFGILFTRSIPAGINSLEYEYSQKGQYNVEKVEILGEDGNPAYVYYYPSDIENKCPVILWGNGSHTGPDTYEPIMRHFASYGFVVMDTNNKVTGTGAPIIDAYHALLTEMESKPQLSDYIDLTKIGLVGHSQGSTGVINAHTNFEEGIKFQTIISVSLPRLKLCDPEDIYDTSKVKVPMMILTGTKDHYISPEEKCLEAYEKLGEGINGVLLNAKGPGHLEFNGDAGKFRGVMTAWFCYQLQGDQKAEGLFYGDDPEIYHNPGWKSIYIK